MSSNPYIYIYAIGQQGCGVCLPIVKEIWYWWLDQDHTSFLFNYYQLDQLPTNFPYNHMIDQWKTTIETTTDVLILVITGKQVETFTNNAVIQRLEQLKEKENA